MWRGGIGERARWNEEEAGWLREWKAKVSQMKALVREKKETCWRRFCEENREKDPWELIRWAKDPLRLKERMGRLVDREGSALNSDQDKANGFIRNIFGTPEEGVS